MPTRSNANEFARRVRLYAQWDQRLGKRTRFFRAAATINAALVQWCRSRCWTGGAAIELLSTAGRQLERLNVAVADRIERGVMQDLELDKSLIALEQHTLQEILRQEAGRAPHRHERAIQQINRLLYCVDRWPAGGLYRDVLRHVRCDLGRQPDFALLHDRIGIGRALILTLNRL